MFFDTPYGVQRVTNTGSLFVNGHGFMACASGCLLGMLILFAVFSERVQDRTGLCSRGLNCPMRGAFCRSLCSGKFFAAQQAAFSVENVLTVFGPRRHACNNADDKALPEERDRRRWFETGEILVCLATIVTGRYEKIKKIIQ